MCRECFSIVDYYAPSSFQFWPPSLAHSKISPSGPDGLRLAFILTCLHLRSLWSSSFGATFSLFGHPMQVDEFRATWLLFGARNWTMYTRNTQIKLQWILSHRFFRMRILTRGLYSFVALKRSPFMSVFFFVKNDLLCSREPRFSNCYT